MQKLHLIGFTTDLDGLIFSARRGTKSGGFTVEIDDDLIRTIEEVMRLRANGEPEQWDASGEEQPTSAWRVTVPQPESVLTPREIQARLRTGVSLAEVAEEAGVDEDWVARFAPPVWAEQARMIATAQGLIFDKPRVGESAEPLGASVRANLADRGSPVDDDTFDAAWGAYHAGATTWVVTFDPPGRTRRQVAMWQFDTATETLTAANRTASDLGYITAKSRRRARQQEGASEATLARVARTATKKSAARQLAAKKTAASRARKKKATVRAAKRPVPVKVTARKAAPKKAAPKKAAPARAVKATKTAPKKSAPKKAAKRASAPARQPAKKRKAPSPPASLASRPEPPSPRVQAQGRFEAPVTAVAAPVTPPVSHVPPGPTGPTGPSEAEMAALREERRRLREERRAAALAAVVHEPEPEDRPERPAVRVAPLTQAPEERRPAPPVIAAAMASDEASGRVVRINATRAAAVPADAAAPTRRARVSERRRRRMFRND